MLRKIYPKIIIIILSFFLAIAIANNQIITLAFNEEIIKSSWQKSYDNLLSTLPLGNRWIEQINHELLPFYSKDLALVMGRWEKKHATFTNK